MFAVVACLAAPVAHAEAESVDLLAVARAGARPPECGGAARGRESRWDRAKSPGLLHYCDALAKGYAVLRTAPEAALGHAATASKAAPGEAAPLVLAGRAETALGRYAEAYSSFGKARALSAPSLEATGALRDFAVAAQRTSHTKEALAAYRTLSPRAELLGDTAEALAVLIEAASLAMAQGPERLTEAVGYLNEARRLPRLPELDDYLVASLALALDRQGRQSEALGIAAESSGPFELESARGALAKSPGFRPVLPDGELDAMIAILAERRDRELSLERWQSFLDSPAGKSGPFAAAARARKDALRRGGRAAP